MNKLVGILVLVLLFPTTKVWAELKAKITVPYQDSIVRGDVPVYGIACGDGFAKYILEYGVGDKPDKWVKISESTDPQTEESAKFNVDFSLDKTIPGNLAMWDTGLTEYQYGEHKIDLPVGIYTLRLTAYGKNREKKEDRVRVEVGRVILNSIGGKVESADKRAMFSVPEHALYSAVEVASLKPIQFKKSLIPKEYTLISEVYELNPPGLEFTRPAELSIKVDPDKAAKEIIFVFNPDKKSWERLKTEYDTERSVLSTEITTLSDKFVLFAVFAGLNITTNEKKTPSMKTTPTGDIVCLDNFRNSFDEWQNTYDKAGAKLELVKGVSKDGNCLRISSQAGKGNSGCTIRSTPFDVNVYPRVSFDYKISKNIKINFDVKVDGKWFEIVFTGEDQIYWEVNMEKAGEIKNIKADNKWHHAEFNLKELLAGRTNTFIVDKMELVSWECTGYRRLEFAENPSNSAFYIDNFKISK